MYDTKCEGLDLILMSSSIGYSQTPIRIAIVHRMHSGLSHTTYDTTTVLGAQEDNPKPCRLHRPISNTWRVNFQKSSLYIIQMNFVDFPF